MWSAVWKNYFDIFAPYLYLFLPVERKNYSNNSTQNIIQPFPMEAVRLPEKKLKCREMEANCNLSDAATNVTDFCFDKWILVKHLPRKPWRFLNEITENESLSVIL